MTSNIRSMTDVQIVEMLVSLKPSDQAMAWLASVISNPACAAGVNELSRRYAAKSDSRVAVPRAKSAGTVLLDGAKFKHLMWVNRIPMNQIGPAIGKSAGLGSVLAHKGRMSYWTADAIAAEIGMHVDAFIEAIASPEELQRLSA